jgi:hypothetical protein
MKLMLRFLILLSGIVSAIALCGFFYAMTGFFLAGPFAQVLNHPKYGELQHSCAVWATYSLIAIATALWLWRTHKRQYGSLWKT